MTVFFEWLEKRQLLVESKLDPTDIEIMKRQINKMFDEAVQTLIKSGNIIKHIEQAESLEGYDWWTFLLKVMKRFPYKGQDLYDAAVNLAGDLWENVFNPNKYEDKNPPLVIFHRMAFLRSQDIAFKFFGWRRKLKTSSLENDVISNSDMFSEIDWVELQQKLLASIEKESASEKNRERAKRAIDVMHVKLTGKSKLYNKQLREIGLDSLASFYHVTKREMYDTLLIVYRSARNLAKEMKDDNLLSKIMGELPPSMSRDPHDLILSLIPISGITHSELFTKAYGNNRELKSLAFRSIIEKLLDSKQIISKKDNSTMYFLNVGDR